MSMLAERKRKQKWCLNPRGTLWSEDSNKFGQKILERMGWSKGKGLGANENGIKEHVRVSFKNDSKGLGFQENSEQWTENEEKFAEILKSLGNIKEDSNSAEAEVKIVSLEELSKKSKARVHYKKFTRGKDLSRASEKDLASIFGKRSSASEKNKECQDDEKSSKEDSNDSNFVNSGSSHEYFKRRLEIKGLQNGYFKEKPANENGELTDFAFKGFSCGADSDANSKQNKYEVTNEGKGFGFAFKVGSSTFSDSVHNGDISKKRKCEDVDDLNEKKKSKKDLEFENSGLTKKKSKKNKQKDVESVDVDSLPKCDEKSEKILKDEGIVNPALELSIDDTDSGVNEIKKKKKKNKQEIVFSDINSKISVDANLAELGVSSGKNKSKKQNGEIEVLDNYIEDHSSKSKKKKKNTVLNNDCLQTINVEVQEKKENENGICNPALELSLEDEVSLETEDKKIKKKKKKNKMEDGLTNPALELSLDDEVSFETKDKSKKSKKKKNKSIEDGVTNPALELSLDDDVSENSIQIDNKIDRKNNKQIIDVIEERIVEIPSSLKKRKYNENGEIITSPKKCKKSVKFNDTLNEEIFITGNSFETNDETKDEKSVDNETVKKQKKKRRKDSVEGGIDNGGFSEKTNEVHIDSAVEKKEKKKRKNKPSENGIDNIGFSEKTNDSVDENLVDIVPKKEKKNRKNKPSENGIDNIGFSEKTNDSVDENLVDIVPKKEKKKRKNKPSENGIDNIGFSEKTNDSFDDNSVFVDCPVTKKEKNKRKNEPSENGIDNIGFSEENNETAETFLNVLEISDTNSNKSKKKKKNKDKEENGIVNPGFEVNIKNLEENESSVNINSESLEVVRAKKINKKQQNEVVEGGVDNIGFSEIQSGDTSTDGNSNKKKKSKDKKRKNSESGPDNLSFETNESEKTDDNDENLTLNMLNILSSSITVNKKKKLKTEKAEVKNGINNLAFDDKMSNNANSSLASDVSEFNLSDAIEVFQAELENNINEAKVKRKTKKDKQSPNSSVENVDISQNVTGNENDNTFVERDSLDIYSSQLQINVMRGKSRSGADTIDKRYLKENLVSGQIKIVFPGGNFHSISGYGPQ